MTAGTNNQNRGNNRIQRGNGRGRGQKPPPLMARPMPPPFGIRRPPMRMHGPPPPPGDPWGMEPPPRFGPPGRGRGMGPHGRGMRPPFGRMPRGGRGGLLPPPMPPMSGMYRPRPPRMMGPPGGMMRGRGGKFNKGGRGRNQKVKVILKLKSTIFCYLLLLQVPNSPTGEMNKPWVTEAMKNEILKKHKLHQKAKKARTKEDWEIFKEHRNKVTTMLREAKLEYIGAHPEEVSSYL